MIKGIMRACAVLFIAAGARAQQGGGSAARTACAADISNFCPSAQGGRSVVQCLQGHKSELSASCQANLPQHGGGRSQGGGKRSRADSSQGASSAQLRMNAPARNTGSISDMCQNEAAGVCKSASSSDSRLLKCLKANMDELSNTCHDGVKAVIKQEKAAAAAKAAAQADAAKSPSE